MCGQVGVIFNWKSRSKREMDYFGRIFTHLLLLSERRGPHAAGVAWLKHDGTHAILKSPGRAMDLIHEDAFPVFLAGIDSNVTWLVGHTRWQTRGDASNNRNNHPIRAGEIIGTANGTITNADRLFSLFGLPREAEVDSELIFRLADSTRTKESIDIPAFTKRLALFQGELSAVMASALNPQEVIVIKGNKPLEVRYSIDHQAVIYASEAGYLDIALAGGRGWQKVNIRPMSVATFSCDNLQTVKVKPFSLDNPISCARMAVKEAL